MMKILERIKKEINFFFVYYKGGPEKTIEEHRTDYLSGKYYRWKCGLKFEVYFKNANKTRVYGYTDYNPEIGEFFVMNMESGKEGVFRFGKVERVKSVGAYGGVQGMFFANTIPVGYRNEINKFARDKRLRDGVNDGN